MTEKRYIDPLEALRAHQGGKCALCEQIKPLVVDHDHETKLVRGLLCYRCNTSEGASDYPWLRAYRANPPAASLGLQVLFGQHRLKTLRGRLDRRTHIEKLAVAASENPDWSPTLPDDPDVAADLLEFWRMFRILGEAISSEGEEDPCSTPSPS